MKKAERVQFILDTLENLYPETPIPLDHTDAYTLLIAVLLSAQCTDKRVNLITPSLFAKANNPSEMVKLTIEEIREIIKPCGLSPFKSKAIFNLSQIILDKHNGQVPETFEEYKAFYNFEDGGDASTGHDLNPYTGEAYEEQFVKRADYARVLAEFWADGPDSETPPGHWFTILNYVNDHPLTVKQINGSGPELSDLEWDSVI